MVPFSCGRQDNYCHPPRWSALSHRLRAAGAGAALPLRAKPPRPRHTRDADLGPVPQLGPFWHRPEGSSSGESAAQPSSPSSISQDTCATSLVTWAWVPLPQQPPRSAWQPPPSCQQGGGREGPCQLPRLALRGLSGASYCLGRPGDISISVSRGPGMLWLCKGAVAAMRGGAPCTKEHGVTLVCTRHKPGHHSSRQKQARG